jgi:hypothetical protein
MIERVHQHLLSELERTTRADTVFVVCAVLFNLLALFISWTQVPTSTENYRSGSFGIYILTTLGIIVVSGAALKALQNGRATCESIHASLAQIYRDASVDKYVPDSLRAMGGSRFRLSVVVVAGTSVLAVAIPLLQYFKL